MRAQSAPGGEATSLVLVFVDHALPGTVQPGEEVQLDWSPLTEAFVLRWRESAIRVKGQGKQNDLLLAHVASRAECMHIVIHSDSERIVLQVREYARVLRLTENHDLYVPPVVAELMRGGAGLMPNPAQVAERFVIQSPSSSVSSPTRMITALSASALSKAGSLRIFGENGALDVRVEGTALVAYRFVARAMPSDGLTLVEGDIQVVSEEPSGSSSGELDAVVRTAAGYLDMWRKYSELEEQLTLERYRRIGRFRFTKRAQSEREVIVLVDTEGEDPRLALLDIEGLRVVAADLTASTFPRVNSESIFDIQDPDGITLEVAAVDLESREVRLQFLRDSEHERTAIPQSGYLIPTARGDRFRLERRKHAWERIASGTAAMPGLQYLIDSGDTTRIRRTPKLRVAETLERHFKHGATPRQREAIELALKTPDIALIQGPPGTGKTQVIAALVDLLSEQLEAVPARHRILVASEQNETVHHVSQRIHEALGLEPVVVSASARSNQERDAWAIERADAITARWSGQAPLVALLQRLVAAIEAAQERPLSSRAALSLLNRFASELPPTVSEAAAHASIDLVSRLRRDASRQSLSHSSPLLRAIRAIPIAPSAIADGGWILIAHAVSLLRFEPETAETRALQGFDEERCRRGSEVAREIAAVRADLLDRYTRSTAAGREKDWRPEALPVLTTWREVLETTLSTSEVGPILAALKFADTLRGDPSAAAWSLEQYSSVTAATNQQAGSVASSRIASLGSNEELWFDTVIIDEAARANPLDLMIPMSMARNRIILVGDHRQLPQMLEPDVDRALETQAGESTREELHTSLFERLVGIVGEADRTRGGRRTVTLDQQFRMHPDLGDFVSEQFYSEDGGVRSPVSATEFVHDDSEFLGSPAVWLDIPKSRGLERRATSRSRTAEAEAVASLAERWLSNVSSQPSIGAISLYSAQVRQMRSELASRGVLRTQESGEIEVPPELRSRLRVGTVDEFQGREFDFVALSLVRCNNDANSRSRYGFLSLANRMCVAMSRQRKLLVVVGDIEMFKSEEAAQSVPALFAFTRMCENRDSVVHL